MKTTGFLGIIYGYYGDYKLLIIGYMGAYMLPVDGG